MDSNVVDKKVARRNRNKGDLGRAVEIACMRLSKRAVEVLESIMNNETAEIKHRIDAAKEIMNRGLGRPKQQIEANVNVHSGESLIEAITAAKDRVAAATIEANKEPTLN